MVSACRVLAPAFWLRRARLRQQISVDFRQPPLQLALDVFDRFFVKFASTKKKWCEMEMCDSAVQNRLARTV